jgi:hypothetical protein
LTRPLKTNKEEKTMKRHLFVFAALAMCLISSAFVPSLKASEFDKRTVITISHAVAVRDTTLPPGKYVLKLQDTLSSQNVIYILNGDGTRLITTVLAIHAFRQEPADKSVFSFYESLSGQPAALHLWFYPGDNDGFEFLRPQHTVAGDPTAGGN